MIDSPDFLRGGGELGALIRSTAWAEGPLGPPETWPQSLKTAIRIMLTSRQPIWIGWGRELIYFYNDAYKSIIGGKHPWALGKPTSTVWSEIWGDIGPLLAHATTGDEGTYVEEQLLIMERSGYPEETYYTFSYSPIPDDDGSAGGIICANSEDTQRVIGERQLASLRELAASTVDARTLQDVCDRAACALSGNRHDLLFALIYVEGSSGGTLQRTGGFGLNAGHGAAPETLTRDTPLWPLREALQGDEPVLVEALPARLGDAFPTGAWQQPSRRAAVLSIPASGETGRAGVLIVGLNPFRVFDGDYRGFLKLAAGQIAAAIANAEAYEQERKRAEALAEIDRAKTAFFSNVSHEFRTPLTLMLGPLEEVLSKRGDAVLADNRALVEVAHRNGLRLMKLVNALLDFSRIEAGRVQATFRPTDLASYTAELASSFRSATERAGLRLTVTTTPIGEPVYVDRDMWEKIVLNLLSNAFKFTFEGGIDICIERAGDMARLDVRDTGIGVAEADLPRLFERFHRIEGARSRSIEGSGIGLALVQELVRLHGGEVSAASVLGEGSIFTITIPLGRKHLLPAHVAEDDLNVAVPFRPETFVQEAMRWLPESAGEEPRIDSGHGVGTSLVSLPPTDGHRPRVVLADDNADMRDYVRRLLSGRYEVEAVSDGVAALAAVQRERPDLLLTDVMMPGLDGFGLLRIIRNTPALSDLPVIMLSARAGEEAQVEGLEAGADDYLAKPFSARELMARVSGNLDLARARRIAADALRQLNQQLAQEKDRLNRMFEQAPTFMAMLRGADHVFDMANPAYIALIGGRDIVGKPLREALPEIESQGFIALLDQVYRDGKAFVGEGMKVILQRNPGSAASDRFVDFVFQPINDSDGKVGGIFIQGSDVTARRQAEDQLRRMNETLEHRVAERTAELIQTQEQLRQSQKLEAMGQLTGGVAHDFNNLLTPIVGSLDMLQRRGIGGDRERRLIDGAMQSAERAKTLVQRLLAFARRQPLQPGPVDLAALITGMADLVASTSGPNITLRIDVADHLPPAWAEPNQLEMAILNLSVNARDAMPQGGTLTIAADVQSLGTSRSRRLAPGDYVRLSVIDTGLGMDQETLTRAVEPFFSTKGVGQGTGLGLSMVHGLALQLGGSLDITSAPARGTRIDLWLPASSETLPMKVTADRPRDDQPAAGTALLVDDEALVRASTADMLTELGYKVIEAGSAREAIETIDRNAAIDLIVTDHLMPGMSGVELVQHIRSRALDIPVLIVSGYADAETLAPGLPRLLKPFRQSELMEATLMMRKRTG